MSLMNFLIPTKQPQYSEILKRLSYEQHIEQTLRDLTGTTLDKTDKTAMEIENEVYNLRSHERYGQIADYVWRRWYLDESKNVTIRPLRVAHKRRPSMKPKSKSRFKTSPQLRVTLGRKLLAEKKITVKKTETTEVVKDSVLKHINNILSLLNKL